jgi:nucleotide-binding universal stress UspA family protein
MARTPSFTILIATDGSEEATGAVTASKSFPWPAGTRAHGVVVRSRIPISDVSGSLTAEIDRSYDAVAESARKVLAGRWPDAKVQVIDGPVEEAIIRHAERLGARVIVMGSRGHGRVARMLIGSVSLGVLRDMKRAALVVRGSARDFTRVTLGFDGSTTAHHAVALLASLVVPAGGQVTMVRAMERPAMTSLSRLPAATRTAIARETADFEATEEKKARREMEAAAGTLRAAGWKVDLALRRGAPLDELLAAAKSARAQLLVLGARGQTRLARLVLGSVAEGALHRSPIPVLVTR